MDVSAARLFCQGPGSRRVGELRIVLGKGGAGRTTVAAALCLSAARKGRAATLVTLSPLAPGTGVAGDETLDPIPFRTLAIDPRAELDAAVARVTGLRLLPRLLSFHPAYAALADVAPGVKEVASLDRIVALSRQTDLVVVDAPATGHGRNLLLAPRKAADLVAGRLRERALAVESALREPTCRATVVATPEEMPVREARELLELLDANGFHAERPVLNRCLPAVTQDEEEGDRLAALANAAGPAEAWAKAARWIDRAHREGEVAAADLPSPRRVPWIPSPAGRLARVADAMEAP